MRRGYILIVVLGLTAVVTTLGWAFLDAHSTVMPEAVNRMGATRAMYLAESGVDLATHYLMYPPTTVSAGDYWHGATGIAIDATSDYTDVSIAQDAVDPNLFKISAVGVAHDPDGTVRGKHSISAQAIVPPDNKWHIPYALLGTSSLGFPVTGQAFGDIHAEGDLVGRGWCQGNVSATDSIWWLGTGPPASITEFADSFTAPSADPTLYAVYNANGTNHSAYNYSRNDMAKADADALNLVDMSATNPGRIIMVPSGVFLLKKDATLYGTLVVDGSLLIDNSGIQLLAVKGYPALVVAGDITFARNDSSVTIVGSVLCGGQIDDDKNSALIQVRGACIVGGDFRSQQKDDTFRFIWDPMRSVFWNFEITERQPITLLSWEDN